MLLIHHGFSIKYLQTTIELVQDLLKPVYETMRYRENCTLEEFLNLPQLICLMNDDKQHFIMGKVVLLTTFVFGDGALS